MLTLICGYRRTGKDYLFGKLSTKTPASMRIYKNPLVTTYNITNYNNFVRIAFADILKQEASGLYDIPTGIFDDEKDVKCYEHYRTGEMVSARDIYNEWGQIRRNEDPDYWCKLALRDVTTNRDINYIVTDWRFRNELEYGREHFPTLITARVYRSQVEEPPNNVISEHDLDHLATDLLITLDNDEEFISAVKRFPQYRNYILDGYI